MTKRVMLVDDIPISNFIMKKMLQRVDPACEVVDFILPEKAIKNLEGLAPDLIFLDLNMPVIDGWKFLKLMNENNMENKVYILTSSTSELDMQQSKQFKNVLGFLVKPITVDILSNLFKES